MKHQQLLLGYLVTGSIPSIHGFILPVVSPRLPGLSRLSASTRSSTSTDVLSTDRAVSSSGDTEVEVAFPPPITKLERLQRSITFWKTAFPIIVSYYGLMYRLQLQNNIFNNSMTEEQVQTLWDELHNDGASKLAATITELKGFYVKTAQIISTRVDLFPKQYTEALSGFTDKFDPMPASLVKAVIRQELVSNYSAAADNITFEDVFVEFDEIPLGAASVAQVHRAVLSEKYGGKEVAVKVQRPSIEPKLLGDVANLRALSKVFRDNPALPLDYYTVFCELEKQLAGEFNFVEEAAAMEKIAAALGMTPDGKTRPIPLVIPKPVPGLVSKRVLVMDYLQGLPLSRAREAMIQKGIDPDSAQVKLFGRQLLSALTSCFGRSILETGFFHADPHPGNILVLDDGRIGLIDFGQVKQISKRNRETLGKIMIELDNREGIIMSPEQEKLVGTLSNELGVEINPDAPPEAGAAVAIWLFDGAAEVLPGGYAMGELSPDSPVKELKSFPQDLVLVGRSTILIKGLSSRLGIPWSLASEWAPIAKDILAKSPNTSGADLGQGKSRNKIRLRIRHGYISFQHGFNERLSRIVRKLPTSVQSRVASALLLAARLRGRITRSKAS